MAATLPIHVAAPSAAAGARVERQLVTMGTRLTVVAEAATRSRALVASERAVEAVAAVDRRLSTWRDDSELAALNRAAAGQFHTLSPALARDLARIRSLWRETGGTFDPAIGALVGAWDLRGPGRVPTPPELAAARAQSGLHRLLLDGHRAVRRDTGLRVEEGGFGKGIALDEAAAAALAAGADCIRLDFGGQLLLAGECRPVTVTVADPRDRSAPALELLIAGGSLATSGNSERGRRKPGLPIGHILDPRTGRPAPDFGSVTVWAPDATTADVLATALFVMGPDTGMAWQRRHRGCEVTYLVRRDEAILTLASPGMSTVSPQRALAPGARPPTSPNQPHARPLPVGGGPGENDER